MDPKTFGKYFAWFVVLLGDKGSCEEYPAETFRLEIPRPTELQKPSEASTGSQTKRASGKNLLSNGGFESPVETASTEWVFNNWAQNQASAELDSAYPHTGEKSQRITLEKVINKPSLQFQYCNLPVNPGESLQLRFWLRGRANTQPVLVQIVKRAPPYTSYFTAAVALADHWSQSVFNLTLPTNLDPSDAALMFTLREENSIWLDDVELVRLPAESEEPVLVGNQIANGSFEVGLDRWYATMRTTGLAATVREEDLESAGPRVVTEPNVPDGNQVLAVTVLPGMKVQLTTAYFPLNFGRPAAVSFWIKSSSAEAKWTLRLGHGKFPAVMGETLSFSPGKIGWNYMSRVFRHHPQRQARTS